MSLRLRDHRRVAQPPVLVRRTTTVRVVVSSFVARSDAAGGATADERADERARRRTASMRPGGAVRLAGTGGGGPSGPPSGSARRGRPRWRTDRVGRPTGRRAGSGWRCGEGRRRRRVRRAWDESARARSARPRRAGSTRAAAGDAGLGVDRVRRLARRRLVVHVLLHRISGVSSGGRVISNASDAKGFQPAEPETRLRAILGTIERRVPLHQQMDDYPLPNYDAEHVWMLDGHCRGRDPSFFFPSDGVGVDHARKVCAGCPVQGRMPRVRAAVPDRARGLGRRVRA